MNQSHIIGRQEIRMHASYDPQGYVFVRNDRVYRAIFPAKQAEIMRLWESGLLDELMNLNLFPHTEITGYRTEDSNLVFEHQRIAVITHPHEWSFNMLKDAALLTLRVNQIAREYGYQTLDAHGFNVAFYRGRAMFIDMGSFVEVAHDFNCKRSGWRPYGEFMRSFLAPLRIWSGGDDYVARHSLYGEQMPMASYWCYRSKLARLIPKRLLRRLEFVRYRYKALNTMPVSSFLQAASVSESRARLGRRVVAFSKRWGLPLSSINLRRLERKVLAIRPPRIPTAWAEYHDNMQMDDRLQHVVDVIKRYRPASVLDMAGNAGYFSKIIAQVPGIEHVICADYDANAIDQLYMSLKVSRQNLYPAVLNFSTSVSNSRFPSDSSRFKVDLVMALAITHHLLLTQNLTVGFILERLKQFSRKYVAVEFMPLGLFSSTYGRIPNVPEWYTVDWFREEFSKHFRLREEEEIATNRIIFVGQVASRSVGQVDV